MDYKALATWAVGDETGASSKAIARHLLGLKTQGSYPMDAGDFGRCEALLDAVPEFRARLSEMANVNPYWAALVPAWEDIRKAPDQYEAIKAITRPVEKNDLRVVRLSDTASIRF